VRLTGIVVLGIQILLSDRHLDVGVVLVSSFPRRDDSEIGGDLILTFGSPGLIGKERKRVS